MSNRKMARGGQEVGEVVAVDYRCHPQGFGVTHKQHRLRLYTNKHTQSTQACAMVMRTEDTAIQSHQGMSSGKNKSPVSSLVSLVF